jgi:AcrR family transcriptional regulator
MNVSNRQDERRESTRAALLEVVARLISRHGLRAITLDQIAREAGYSRGAIYHLYRNKDELAIAALAWIVKAWEAQVLPLLDAATDPVRALYTIAAQHAIFCRRDVARVAMSLRYEYTDPQHPVGAAIEAEYQELYEMVRTYIESAQTAATIGRDVPSPMLAEAFVGVLEGVVIAARGQEPLDAVLAVRSVAGVLGLPHDSALACLKENGFA